MYKKRIGISVYPEKAKLQETLDYIKLANKYGYDMLFVSFIHMLNNKKEDLEKVLTVIKTAKELNYYVIADFEYESLKMLNVDINNPIKIKEYGIDCIRFDSPALASEISKLTHNEYDIDIQLNISNNDHFIDNVLDYKPIVNRLSGCHNFYPQKYTGLPYDFFTSANKKYIKNGIPIGAFIGSHYGNQGPAKFNKELVTLEMSRDLSVIAQAKTLFYCNEIDFILFGNAFAKEAELKAVSNLNREEITLTIIKDKKISKAELNILNWKEHFRRGDICEFFIRSTMTRVIFKDAIIEPNNIKKKFNIGDVVIVNSNGGSYKGELHIILKDNFIPENNSYNYIGKVSSDELNLLEFILPWTYFRFD